MLGYLGHYKKKKPNMGNFILSTAIFLISGLLLVQGNSAPQFYRRVSIQEDALLGAKVMDIECHDDDGDIPVYTLTPESDYFSINPSSGEIVVSRPLDYEAVQRFELTVSCMDSRQPELSSSTKISIQVIDVNDNAPQFQKNMYHADVQEGNPSGLSVMTVRASDADAGKYGQVRYEILGGERSFAIDENTGEIRATVTLDREVKATYHFLVEAHDCAHSDCTARLSSRVQVTVDVTDVNDNCPVFSSAKFRATTLDGAPIGTIIMNVRAIDFDSGRNAVIIYQLESGDGNSQGSQDLFNIDPYAGTIATAVSLEGKTGLHHFNVTARNPGNYSCETTASVEILVVASDAITSPPIG